jgi:putative tryptophan/tyrosine transport system substrate-binding protein
MRRREFITLVGGAAAAWPLAARAQQPKPMRLISVLMGYAESDSAAQSWLVVFRGELSRLGWTEGSNLQIELRWGAADQDKIKTLAKELVNLRPDAILSVTTPVTSALAHETRTLPIVFAVVADPIGSGFVPSLSRPGGNITGFTTINSALGGKWVELLKEIAPHTVRMALMTSIKAAASSLGVEASAAPVHVKDEIEGVVAAQARNPGGGLIVMPEAFNVTNRHLIIALVARYGVPAIYATRFYAESGGLITYGVDYAEQFRQAAGYIDRVLKGTMPADLSVQQPTKFEFVINLKTANALGLTIPDKLLATADDVIE